MKFAFRKPTICSSVKQPMQFDDIDWTRWIPKERATLLFVVRDGQILLIHKKRGLGAGKINGPGGRLDPGETPEICAVREEDRIESLVKGDRGTGDMGR